MVVTSTPLKQTANRQRGMTRLQKCPCNDRRLGSPPIGSQRIRCTGIGGVRSSSRSRNRLPVLRGQLRDVTGSRDCYGVTGVLRGHGSVTGSRECYGRVRSRVLEEICRGLVVCSVKCEYVRWFRWW